jgi:hypothetical protein
MIFHRETLHWGEASLFWDVSWDEIESFNNGCHGLPGASPAYFPSEQGFWRHQTSTPDAVGEYRLSATIWWSLRCCLELSEALALTAFDGMRKREKLGTLAYGRGYANPHIKMSGYNGPIRVAWIRLQQGGFEFWSVDQEPVFLIAVQIGPDDRPGDWLRVAERISRSLRIASDATTLPEMIAILEEL